MRRTTPEAFLAAYDAVLATRWPAGTEKITVRTPYGATHINAYGPKDAPPLILLPGGGATSTVWFAQVAELGRTHRVLAPDLIGEPGRSVAARRPIRRVRDLTAWLDVVLDGLGLDSAVLAGHSYGGWIALHYALHAPDRVRRLVLVDPTGCFAGFSPRYLLRALPMLLRPTPQRTRAFLKWETRGAALDRTWLSLQDQAVGFPAARPVTGPRPDGDALRRLDVPTLLLLGGRSRAHPAVKVARAAGRLLPRLETVILPEATHHSLPQYGAGATELNRRTEAFLTEDAPA